MIPRYSRKVMARIWTEENKFASWLKVELAAMRAMAECGLIPPEVPKRAARKAKIDVARILEIEAKTHHDVAAFVDQVAAGLGEDGRYFHFGLTSSDVLDTALGLRLTEAADLLLADLDDLLAVLKEKAYAFKDQPMVGRTHGVHAEPITLGLKFALWYAEFKPAAGPPGRGPEKYRGGQNFRRGGHLRPTGPGGGGRGLQAFETQTRAHFHPGHPAGPACRILSHPGPDRRQRRKSGPGDPPPAAHRGTGGGGDVRRRPEGLVGHAPQAQPDPVGKPLRPGPGASGQRPGGPGKRGPVARAGHQPLLGGAGHRRRIPPCSWISCCPGLTRLLKNLQVYPEHMAANLRLTRGLVFSQSLLLALIDKGLARDAAYRLVQRPAMQVWEAGGEFAQRVKADAEISQHLTPAEIEAIFDLKRYFRHVDEIFARVFGEG